MTPPSGPRVVGVDLSLTSTGLADSHGRTERVRTKATDGSLGNEATRMVRIGDAVRRFARFGDDPHGSFNAADLVVVEGPSYASTSGQQHTRGGLWWMTVTGLLWRELRLLSIAPKTLKTYATGRGNADKDAVLAAVVKRYADWDVTGNDVADAVILAAIGSRLLGHPIDDLPKTHLRALDKVALP